MSSHWLRIIALLMLAFGALLVGESRADDDNEVKFRGVIESLPATSGFIGDWKVSGRTVHVTSATEIDQEEGHVAVGAMVKVEGTIRSDSSIDAKEIEVVEAEAEIEFTGVIESLPGTPGFIGDWKVSGRTVHVMSSTKIEAEDGAVVVGAMVQVEGTQRPDGSIDAAQIEVKANVVEFEGVIESLPNTTGLIGDWKVSGKIVHVGAATTIDQEHGAPAVGASVEVKGTMRADGSIDAVKIEVKSRSEDSEGESATIKGAIQSLPPGLMGDWTVAGQLVHVVSSTRLIAGEGAFSVGARVKVKGMMMADRSVVATKVVLKESN